MSVIDDLRKVLQDFIAPELRTINARLDNINDRFKSLEEKMDLRFDAVMKELATDKRIERLERLAQKSEQETKQ
jgi:hypothetical protein